MTSAKYPEETLNLVQIYLNRVTLHPTREALFYKQEGKYQALTWGEWADRVKKTALGLYALGVRCGDRVGVLSENRPEWTMADLGTLSLGAATVPIYPTSSTQDIAYLVKDAGIKALFVSNAGLLEKVKGLFLEHSGLKQIVSFDHVGEQQADILPFAGLLEKGRCQSFNNSTLYETLVARVKPSDMATIIYTSGTTGPPKGVVLTHQNFISNYRGAQEYITVSPNDLSLSFLPLSHVFERLAGYYFMIAQGARIAYAENMQTVPEDLLAVSPTVAAAVPRFFEKIHANIFTKAKSMSPLQQTIFNWALAVGKQMAETKINKTPVSGRLALQHFFADRIVFSKIRAGLGGRIRFFISGGAPLDSELARFFYSVGILILEGYGLTETSPVIAVNSLAHFKFGTVGKVLPNVRVRIAEDGEILTQGPCVMKGYYKGLDATREVIRDGWFVTGDIGELDTDGFLKITGRKKDIIVTSGGKNISPQNIENLILRDPLFQQVVVIGDRRNYLVALIVPQPEELKQEATHLSLNGLGWEKLLEHPKIYARVQCRVEQQTRDLAAYEQIKYFSLLSREFTISTGELTPTLKIKRKIVAEKYKDCIEALYQKGAGYQPVADIAG